MVKKAIRPAIFTWRQTEPELILCAVRWYLRDSLSFRDGEERLRARGLEADPTTIWRWVQHDGPELAERLRRHPSAAWRESCQYTRSPADLSRHRNTACKGAAGRLSEECDRFESDGKLSAIGRGADRPR